jgi:hypothetical protein
MAHSIICELEETKKRLNYYQELKNQKSDQSGSLLKWIDIYNGRVANLEKQAKKAGLLDQKSPTDSNLN